MASLSIRNERKHRRKIYVGAFAYRFLSASSDVHFGVISNISDAGMCMYSDVRPRDGESIEFRSSLPVPFTKAAVRWVKEDVNNLYKIGISFIE
jgi:hypothetical protein